MKPKPVTTFQPLYSDSVERLVITIVSKVQLVAVNPLLGSIKLKIAHWQRLSASKASTGRK
jgi:hypothetical protein